MPLYDTVSVTLATLNLVTGVRTEHPTSSRHDSSRCYEHDECKPPPWPERPVPPKRKMTSKKALAEWEAKLQAYNHARVKRDEDEKLAEEVGRGCAQTQFVREHSDPVLMWRYDYEDDERNPETGRYDVKVRRFCEATVYRKYVGQVVARGVDFNKQVMSDVWDDVPYVILWVDGREVKLSRYNGPGYHRSDVHIPYIPDEVDATPEVLEELAKERAARKVEADKQAREAAEKKRIEDEERERKAVKKGRMVRVVRGRKVPLGTQGVVFWMGESQWGWRAGFKTADGEVVWIDAKNVEAVTA